MAQNSKIEWTDASWNPITGCSKISEGCKNCYAERMANRLAGRYGYPKDDPFKPGTFHPDRIDINLFVPGKRVFVCSMGDLFHEKVNIRGEWIREIFRCMAHHDNTFFLLTKRPERMKTCIEHLYGNDFAEQMPDVWVGVTAENQKQADERIPILLQIPAAVRFVSVEPMLGPVDFNAIPPFDISGNDNDLCTHYAAPWDEYLSWVICGGESGPSARPMHPAWAKLLRDQCVAADIPFFFKQWGEWAALCAKPIGSGMLKNDPSSMLPWGDMAPKVFKIGKKKAGNLLDGKVWNQYPSQ